MKKKLLFINGNLRTGGVEMALVNLLNCIDSSKYEVDLLLIQNGYDYESDLPEYVNCIKVNLEEAQGPFGASVIKNVRNRNWDCVNYRIVNLLAQKTSLKLFRFLSLGSRLKSRYDAVIAFRPGICADIALYRTVSDLKICWWHHGEINVGIPLNILNEQLSKFDKIVAVSNGVKAMLYEALPDLASKIVVIHNIIDIDRIRYKSNDYVSYQKNNHSDKCYEIVTVSRLSKEKNVDRAVEVADILRRRGVQFRWHIVGDGDCQDEIVQQIKQHSLESYIFLAGKQVNPYPWIKNADLMVHLSTIESFGLVILEAMALGVPCVAVESIGSRELINKHNGILTKNDSEIIADNILFAIKNGDEMKNFVNNADCELNRFSSENIAQSFNKIVND